MANWLGLYWRISEATLSCMCPSLSYTSCLGELQHAQINQRHKATLCFDEAISHDIGSGVDT